MVKIPRFPLQAMVLSIWALWSPSTAHALNDCYSDELKRIYFYYDSKMTECIRAIPITVSGSADLVMSQRCQEKYGENAQRAAEANARVECRVASQMNLPQASPVSDPMGDTMTGDMENNLDTVIVPAEQPVNNDPPFPMPRRKDRMPVVQQPAVTPAAATETPSFDPTSDITACSNAANQARSCCASPESCGTVSVTEEAGSRGTKSCKQLARLGELTSQAFSQKAAICSSRATSCETVCGPLLQKYQNLVSNCAGCGQMSIYQNALDQIRQKAGVCTDQASVASGYRSQASEGAIAAGRGESCKDETALAKTEDDDDSDLETSGLGGLGDIFGKSTGSNDDEEPRKKAEKESQPQVEAVKEVQRGASGTAFTQYTKSVKPEDFNVNDVPIAQDTYLSSTGPGGEAPTVTPPPNNTGGAIPGGGPVADGSSAPRKAAGSAFFPQNKVTDVFPGGYMPGGYSASYSTQPGERDIDGTRYRRGNRRAKEKSGAEFNGYMGMDLKRFLPGQSLDPNRRLAGVKGPGVEINGKGADVWNKITEKMIEKCRLGILWKCQP